MAELLDVYVTRCLHRRAGTGNTASATFSCILIVALATLSSLCWIRSCKILHASLNVTFRVDKTSLSLVLLTGDCRR